jgi:hypothetical protein
MQKSTLGLVGLFSALLTANASALDFTADLTTDLNTLQSLHSVYGLSGKYATGFIQTLTDTQTGQNVTMEVGYSLSPATPLLTDPRSIAKPLLGEFISLDHGFFIGHMEIPNLIANVATSFTITFNSNVNLDSIFFDDIATPKYKPNAPAQFTVSWPGPNGTTVTTPPLQGVDVITNHNVNNLSGHVMVNIPMLANQPYTITVIPVPGAPISLLEIWKFRVTPSP